MKLPNDVEILKKRARWFAIQCILKIDKATKKSTTEDRSRNRLFFESAILALEVGFSTLPRILSTALKGATEDEIEDLCQECIVEAICQLEDVMRNTTAEKILTIYSSYTWFNREDDPEGQSKRHKIDKWLERVGEAAVPLHEDQLRQFADHHIFLMAGAYFLDAYGTMPDDAIAEGIRRFETVDTPPSDGN